MTALPLLGLLATLAAQVPTPTPTPLPATSPMATVPAAVGTPVAPVSPGATAPAAGPSPLGPASAEPGVPTPTALPTASPTPSPYAYRFVPRQPDHPAADQPQIFAVYLNSKKLRSQGPIMIRVTTSPGVVKVVSSSNGKEGVVPKISDGDFEASSMLPKLPFIASGITTTIDFIAVGASGKRVTVPVPVVLQ